MRQIPLYFQVNADVSRENFQVSASNEEAYTWIGNWPDWPGKMLYLYGPPMSGKTHLASIWQHDAQAHRLDVAALQLSMIREDSWYLLDGLQDVTDEEAWFHCYNMIKNQQAGLLVTAEVPPAQLPFTLPDVRSRMQAITTVAIHAPDDRLLETVLRKQLADRQLRVSNDVIQYIILRIERSFAAVYGVLEQLDQSSLELQRPVTIPLVKQVLGL